MIVAQFQVLAIQGEVEGDATRKQIVREISPGRASQDQKISGMIQGSGPRITWPYRGGTAVVISLLAY
jgi:hypothetical protein